MKKKVFKICKRSILVSLLFYLWLPCNLTAQNLIFIDIDLPDQDLIVNNLKTDVECFKVDGFDAISAHLKKYDHLETVSIVSHGDKGLICLGGKDIDVEYLQKNSTLLESFRKVDDLLLYGCNVAKGIQGKYFINCLRSFVNKEVYASDNLTGHNGDWELEYASTCKELKKSPFKSNHFNYPYNLQKRFLLIHENKNSYSYNINFNKWTTAIGNNCAIYDQIVIDRNLAPDTALNIFNNPVSNTYYDGGIIIASIPNNAPVGNFSLGGVFASATPLQITNLYNYIDNGGSVYIQTEYNWRNLEIVDDLMDEMGVLDFTWGGITMASTFTINPPFESSNTIISPGPNNGAASNYVATILPGPFGTYCPIAYNSSNLEIGFVYTNGNGHLFTFSDCNFWAPGANSTIDQQGFLNNFVYLMLNPAFSCGGTSPNIPPTYICNGDSAFFDQSYYSTSGMYQSILTSSLGCDSLTFLNLIVDQCVDSSISTLCQGDSVQLFGNWELNTGIYADTLLNGTIHGLDSVVLIDLTVLPLAINSTSAEICQGDSVEINGVYWTDDGTFYDTIFNGSINNCDSVIEVNITVIDNPVISSIFQDDSCQQSIGFVDLNISGGIPPYSYFWSNAAITEDLIGIIAGEYSVEVTDDFGCMSTEQFNLGDVFECESEQLMVFVPNSFTPGNSDGVNDVFSPIISGLDISDYEFYIFNRWGEVIFYSNNANESWDGTFKGVMSLQDVYIWKITFVEDGLRKWHQYNGHVVLLK